MVDTISVAGFTGRISTDTYPVVVKMRGHVLKIPRNYLETAAPTSEDVYFMVVLSYPEFHPVDTSSESMFRSLTSRSGSISSRAGWWFLAPDNAIWAYPGFVGSTRKAWLNPVLEAAKNQHITSNEYGLAMVRGPLLMGEYYAFMPQTAEEPVVIKCHTVIKNAICESEFDLAPGLVVEYGYSRNNLPQWREIDKQIKRILSSFLED